MNLVINNLLAQTTELVHIYWPMIPVLFFVNLFITFLRSFRVKSITNTSFVNIFYYYSCVRFIAWILPFKLDELVSVFFMKKLIGRKGWGHSISTLFITKLSDYIFLILIISILLIIFTLFRQNELIGFIAFIILPLLLSIFFFKREFLIEIVIQNLKKIFKLRLFKNIENKFSNFLSDSRSNIERFILRKDFWLIGISIAMLQIFFATSIAFGSSDRVIDFELFIIVFSFIIIQSIPLKLFFGIGIFDIYILLLGYITPVGFTVYELILFRSSILFIIILELLFVSLGYIIIKNILK